MKKWKMSKMKKRKLKNIIDKEDGSRRWIKKMDKEDDDG